MGAGVTTFGYGYELATIGDQTVAGGSDVPFSNSGPLSGITHPTTTTFVVPTAGSYQINYGVSISAGVGSAIAITVNGTPSGSTNITALVAAGEMNGTATLTLAAGDVLTLQNNSATPLTMPLAPSVGAQFDVIFLS